MGLTTPTVAQILQVIEDWRTDYGIASLQFADMLAQRLATLCWDVHDSASPSKPEDPKWQYATGDDVEIPREIAQYNEAQRHRREGYMAACYNKNAADERIAAEKFPLKKRVSRVVHDPHLAKIRWRVTDTGDLERSEIFPNGSWGNAPFLITLDRVRVLYDLITNPFEWVEDKEPEP